MDIPQQFTSSHNKHFLWNFISKIDWFNNIPEEKKHLVRDIFEKNIHDIVKKHDGLTLLNYNKIFLESMKERLNTYKTVAKKVSFSNLQDTNVITIEEERKGRQNLFNTQLKERETDFASLLKRPLPKKVDFGDTTREIKIKDMEDHIEQIVKERNSQINSIFAENNDNIPGGGKLEVIIPDINEEEALPEPNRFTEIKPEKNLHEKNLHTGSFNDNTTLETLIETMNTNIKDVVDTQKKILSILDKVRII